MPAASARAPLPVVIPALLAACGCAAPALADIASVAGSPLSGFVIFSGGGATFNSHTNYDTAIGGHTTIHGDIGSNQDLRMVGGQDTSGWAQVFGSVYTGGYLNLGQPLTVGSPTLSARIVVNGTSPTAPGGATEADLGGTLYGNLFATGDVRLESNAAVRRVLGVGGNVQYTGNYSAAAGSVVEGTVAAVASTTAFTPVTMPAATPIVAGGANQTVSSATDALTLGPGVYGTLATSQQDQSITLSSGVYALDGLSAHGGLTLNIDLSSGLPISVYALGDMTFGQRSTLMVRGAGTGGAFVPISDAPALASLIYFETHGRFVMGGATAQSRGTWGGTVYASAAEDAAFSGSVGEVQLGQFIDWYGAVYAFDSIDIADHGSYTLVAVPAPSALPLLACAGVLTRRRR